MSKEIKLDQTRKVRDEELKPYTAVEMADILIHEATNEHTRNMLLEKMHFIMSLEGNKQMHEKMMGNYQMKARMSRDAIRVLGSLRVEMDNLSKPKEEAVDKPVEKKKKKMDNKSTE